MLESLHDSKISGHLGRNKTLAKVNERFYRPYLCKLVKDYIKTCDVC